tara:strand:- start:456 stop:731 length:276 start_codon:yes stop_codon:yes gene_type:complete
MTRDKIEEFIEINTPHAEVKLINGMDDAFVGICERIGMLPVAAYDTNKCIEILEQDNEMEHEEAADYFGFNIIGAWEGEGTAVFITSMEKE